MPMRGHRVKFRKYLYRQVRLAGFFDSTGLSSL